MGEEAANPGGTIVPYRVEDRVPEVENHRLRVGKNRCHEVPLFLLFSGSGAAARALLRHLPEKSFEPIEFL